MKETSEMEYCKDSEKLVNILMKKTQNNNPLFFRVLVGYNFAKLASMMRTNINVHGRGVIPVSMYALNLATSGAGKGFSTNIIEEQVIHKFRKYFMNDTFPAIAEKNLAILANKRAMRQNEDPDDMLEKVQKEFKGLGKLLFSFDSGTSPAVKQMRHILLMSCAGSVNLEIDEIGSNLTSNIEVLNTFLELFDVGKVKQKLIKNTNDNVRSEDIDGRTPTNMMLFGTPAKLLNGGKTEEELHSMLETGFARRCVFGFSTTHERDTTLTPEQIYDQMGDTSDEQYLADLSDKFEQLADMVNFDTTLTMTKTVNLLLIEYKLQCEILSDEMKEHEEVNKAELAHRYYKAVKLAGAYAFIEGNHEISEDNLYAAIKLVEESGEAFARILTRERNYVKLAKYIASIGREVTQVDLIEDLPFYKGSEAQKKDMMTLAVAYGCKNNIVIKKSYSDGIEFLEGESMDITDLEEMRISYSTNITKDFQGDSGPFEQMHNIVKMNGYHYTAHHFKNGYRDSAHAIQGFNLVILDIDEGISLASAKFLLKGYKALFATTKRHTDQKNRFRIIMPLSHIVKLTSDAHKKFMENVFDWLPFETDDQTKDIARKWESFNGSHSYQDGELLDALLFIPQTRKAEDFNEQVLSNTSLNNLERWFFLNTSSGNRSNQVHSYARALVDSGQSFDAVKMAVMSFNSKLKNSLSDDEINNTILVTVMRAVAKRDS